MKKCSGKLLGFFLIAEDADKENILADLHRTLAVKVQTMVERLGIEPDCALVGGKAKDIWTGQEHRGKLSLQLCGS